MNNLNKTGLLWSFGFLSCMFLLYIGITVHNNILVLFAFITGFFYGVSTGRLEEKYGTKWTGG